MEKPTVALVGRPNVGKSTLFNRLVGQKISITEDTPGVTRDRIYGNVTYKDYQFHLIDTGGIDETNKDFNKQIKTQVELAIDESDKIVFVVDGKEGLTSNDLSVRDMLTKRKKDVVVAINKADTNAYKDHQYDFYELGFSEYIPLSSEHNFGIYDLLDKITENFKPYKEEKDDIIRFSLIGRPNVGKSSLVNAILNEDRAIVSEIAGTTRDASDTEFTYHKQKFIVIDTAGMRKKGKAYETIEKYSLLRSMKAIDRSNVCVIVLDATQGIREQDKHIIGYALDAGKALVLAINKYDLIEDKEKFIKNFDELTKYELQFIPYVQKVYLSALTKKRVNDLLPLIQKAYTNATKQIKTSDLNNIIREAYELNLPPTYKNKRLKIYFSHQTNICPPTFNIEVNSKGLIHFSYERYLENQIRENFDFTGTPIKLNFKNKGE